MNSHWLKQVYARMLTENSPQDVIKIFKQEEGDTEADHVASINRPVFNRVKDILEPNNLESQNADMSLVISSLEGAGIPEQSNTADNFKRFVKEAGLTFTKENQDACKRRFIASAEGSETISFLKTLDNAYDTSQSQSHYEQFKKLVGRTKSDDSNVGAGPGEEAINFFTGGKKEGKGDCLLEKGAKIEVKAKDGRLHKRGDWKGYLKAYIQNGEKIEDYRKLINYLSTTAEVKEILNGSFDDLLLSQKDELTEMLKNKAYNGKNANWKNLQETKYLLYAGNLKEYSNEDEFQYFCFIVSTGSDYELRFINTKNSIQQIYNHLINNQSKFPFTPVFDYELSQRGAQHKLA